MRSNATSGLPLTLCVSVCALITLFAVIGSTDAKRGCSAFGHSCFGGHGKRFDPHLRETAFQASELAVSDSAQEAEEEALRFSNELAGPRQNFRGQEEVVLPQTRRQDSSRFDPYTLSFIVRQWLTSHHRLHQPDMELNKK